MQGLYEFERHPLQAVIDTCDSAIASYHKSLFIGCTFTVFNTGMVLIRSLELWAEMPWQWFPTGATLGILLTHVFALVVVAGTWRWTYTLRQRWVNLRKACVDAINAQSAIEFHIDQINASLERLNKL